jgi:DNA-directed RNA polymerase, mitochondrial
MSDNAIERRMSDIDNTIERRLKAEYFRTDHLGFGLSRQGLGLAEPYVQRLAQIIATDRAGPSNPLWESLQKLWRPDRELRRALKDLDDDDIARRLLLVGISICFNERLGADDDGTKNYRDIAIAIGGCLGRRGKVGLKLGGWGINMLTELPLFTLDDNDVLTLSLTDEEDESLTEIVCDLVRRSPFLAPVARPPEPWTGFNKGGLPADLDWAKVDLIRHCHPSQRNAVIKAIGTGKMKPVLDAMAAFQSTALMVNKPLLEFIKKTAAPSGPDKKLIERKDWFAKQKLAAINAQITVWDSDITVAESAPDPFFDPAVLDFRGRIYGMPSFNYARTDYVRALFLFADGEPINEEGLSFLKAHVAAKADGNSWSREKKPSSLDHEGRIAWTEENLPMLLKIGLAVLHGEDDWLSRSVFLPGRDDDRYQFVASCIELTQAIASFGDDAGFITRLPLSFDATNSAGQHYSAMTGSKEEGRLVNLTGPETGTFTATCEETKKEFSYTVSGAGDDLYRRIIFEVWREWQKPWPEHPDEVFGRTAQEWRAYQARTLFDAFDRSLVKKAVVAYFYGSRAGKFEKDGDRFVARGMTAMIAEEFKERKQFSGHAKQLAKLTQDAIKKVMPKACEARSFLRKLAKVCAEHNKPFRWTTATGMPVINAYYPPIIKRYKAPVVRKDKAGNKVRATRFVNLAVDYSDKIDRTDAVRSAPANFIHSLDAAHLHLIRLATAAEKIPLVAVHDSFATIATRAKRLKEIIPEQFVALHETDWLNAALESVRRDLPKTVKLPGRPKRGTLDITDVRKNFRAFS